MLVLAFVHHRRAGKLGTAGPDELSPESLSRAETVMQPLVQQLAEHQIDNDAGE